jgi:hypothetical protein
VVIRHDGKLIREPVGQNRKEAERALDARRGDVARRTYRVLRDIRFDEWADSWLAGFTGKENSRRVYAHTIAYGKQAFGAEYLRAARHTRRSSGRRSARVASDSPNDEAARQSRRARRDPR